MRQFVTCTAHDQLLAIDILNVREVVRVTDITPAPLSSPTIRGLLNLRGRIVTVFDLSVCLGEESLPVAPDSRIVVLRTERELEAVRRWENRDDLYGSEDPVGLLVKSVGDVVAFRTEEIEATPANVAVSGAPFVSELANAGDQLYGLINVRRLLEMERYGGRTGT